MQLSILSLPEGEIVPVGHSEQKLAPGIDLYLPVSHSTHITPSDSAVLPGVHMQLSILSLPMGELVPIGHCEQLLAPGIDLYLPTSHSTHIMPSDFAVLPGVHIQLSRLSLPMGEIVPVGHSEQILAPGIGLYLPVSHSTHITPSKIAVWPGVHMHLSILSLPMGELVPTGQSEQFPIPGNGLYLPVSQSTQSTPSNIAVLPVVHTQLSILSLPVGEFVPIGQSEQILAPGIDLYLPASHTTHITPSDLAVLPGVHTQL